jgi:hypothetical protein
MHKKTTFGKGEAYLLDNETKTKVIDYLYSKLDLTKFRYVMLNNIQKLKFLQENEHYVSPNFKGYNYLLIMMTLNNKHCCFAIDRKKLSYHKSQLDMKTINIFQINIKATESIFRGSIFDAKLIFNNNEYIFLFQDCFYLMGDKILNMEMIDKMSHIDTILNTHFKNRNDNPNFIIKLNKLYQYNELENLISNLPKLSIGTNGIIFYPKLSGITVIHIEKKIEKVEIISNNNEVIEQKSYHIIHNFVDFLKSRNYSYEQNSKTKLLWLSRTAIADVYDIAENEFDDKLGIALIPNLKTSHLCDELISDKPVRFNCIYSNKFKKWIPLNVV